AGVPRPVRSHRIRMRYERAPSCSEPPRSSAASRSWHPGSRRPQTLVSSTQLDVVADVNTEHGNDRSDGFAQQLVAVDEGLQNRERVELPSERWCALEGGSEELVRSDRVTIGRG